MGSIQYVLCPSWLFPQMYRRVSADGIDACGYQKDGKGICNSTIFGYPMEPLTQIQTDVPDKDGQKKRWSDIIPASSFKDNGYNHGSSRAGSLMIFVSFRHLDCWLSWTYGQVGSCLVLLSLIFGLIRARLFFLVAAACAGVGALLLLV